jgi:hypothetical protein
MYARSWRVIYILFMVIVMQHVEHKRCAGCLATTGWFAIRGILVTEKKNFIIYPTLGKGYRN